jgi:hypothetical protein
MTPFKGQKGEVWAPLSDGEAKHYASDFKTVLEKAGWDCGKMVAQAAYAVDPIGVSLMVNPKDVESEKVPPATLVLANTLLSLGIVQNKPRSPQ